MNQKHVFVVLVAFQCLQILGGFYTKTVYSEEDDCFVGFVGESPVVHGDTKEECETELGNYLKSI